MVRGWVTADWRPCTATNDAMHFAEDGGAGRQAGDAADPLQPGEHGDAHQDGHPHRDKARSGPGNAPRV